MYIRKRGQFYHYEFFVNGNRYAGSFNGKNGAKTAANKKEATEFAYQERRKVLDGTFRDEMEREELKDFVTFVDKVTYRLLTSITRLRRMMSSVVRS